MREVETVVFNNGVIRLIDQTKLPLKEEYIITDELERIALAIERLEVRGAPAIGVTAAYALALAFKNIQPSQYDSSFDFAYKRLYSTRPTAVNLFYALNEIKKIFDENKDQPGLYHLLLKRAIALHEEDKNLCDRMASNGLEIFYQRSRILTHCNTGALATGGKGTALNIIRHAFENGLVDYVYADETRPLLQGSRLTAWELDRYKIPFSIITDSTAAFLMQQGKIDLVITGADRVAVNGDVANKIGTYNLAVLCFHHNIPFYIAAPGTSIDAKCMKGDDINIELRSKTELTWVGNNQISKDDFDAYCPAFDITPNKLIKGIITEKKLYTPRFDFSNV